MDLRTVKVLHPSIQFPHNRIIEFCKKHGIRRLSVFGSALRDDFSPTSDIDLLVEFQPGQTPGFFRMAGLEIELSNMLGRKVDLRTPSELSRYFRDKVLASSEIQYDAA
jgi:predicted nucleotidyltransferase